MDLLRIVLTLGILALYSGFILFEMWLIVFGKGDLPPENETRTYFFTGASALIGGLVASMFGVEVPETLLANIRELSIDDVKLYYVVAWLVVGLLAVVTSLIRSVRVTRLVRNTATSFLGIAFAIIAASLLIPTDTTRTEDDNANTLTYQGS